MRKILVLALIAGFGAAVAVAETTGTCSIRPGRSEESCRSAQSAEIASLAIAAIRTTQTCSGASGPV